MSTPRVTDAKLQRAREEREYWKMKNEASTLKSEVESLNPEMLDIPASTRRGASVGQRLKETYLDALEVKAFKDTIEGGGSKPQLHDVAASKARIVEALVKAGKTSDEITQYMDRVSSHLDLYAMSSDPAVQALLFNRVMAGNGQQQLGLKDVLDAMKLANDMRPQQQQSDPAAMVSAVAQVFKVAHDSRNNPNPVETFNQGINTIMPLFQQMNETQKIAFTAQIESLRSELQQKDPGVFFSRMKEFAENLGWRPGGSEDPEVLKHRLHLEDQRDQRSFEWNKFKFETENKAKEQANTARQQSELVRNITGAIQKVVESPVAKELGRSVGGRIGVPHNPVSRLQSQAAASQLANPMEANWSFTCPKCNTAHTFSPLQLEKIKEAGGRWVCPTGGCGAPYELKDPGEKS